MRATRIVSIGLGTMIVAAGVGGVAGAAAPEGTAAENGALEEVVVTAQRRAEDPMTIPIAITAINGDQLNDKAVTRLADLQYASPALTISDAGLTQSVNIRGIGLASGSPAVANGVATYVDGLFQPPIVSTNIFYDIANVEVLRGPQGTLVGSNSTGGAIFINSQNPKLGATGGYVELGAGNFGVWSAQGAMNLPVSDTLAFRVAGNLSKRDSFYDSVGSAPTKASELDEKSGRLSMLWKPGAFQALAKVEYVDRNTGGYAYRPIPGTQYAAAAPADPFTLKYDSPTLNYERGLISDLELRYEFANGLTVRSLSGYQDKNIHNLYDSDGTSVAVPPTTSNQNIRERVWTQEVNVISPTNGSYNWIVGAYGQKNKIDVHLLNNAGSFPIDILNPQNKTTTGWFGQLNVKLGDRLELQTGARYSTFDVDGIGHVIIGFGLPGFGNLPGGGLQVANLSGGHKDGRGTGKVALNFNLDKNNLFYAFVAKGYKPGGFNSSVSQFDPESVIDIEAGWKGTSQDGHVRSQIGVFNNSYHDFQFGLMDLSSGRVGVANLPSATIRGFEAQIQAQLGGWTLDGGAAYVDSKIGGTGSFVNTLLLPPPGSGNLGPQCANGATTGCFDYTPYLQTATSGPNLYSPKWSLNAGVEYRFAVGSGFGLTPRLNYAYLGSQYTSLSYSPVTDYLAARGLLSALLTLQAPGHWSVEAYGTNLTDKVYFTGQSGTSEFVGAPRQYGVRLRATY